MTVVDRPAQPIQINKRLLVPGVVLVGIGGLSGAAGMMLATYALVSASRQWVKQQETPPREMVRQRMQQARVAGSAAADAWRSSRTSGTPTST